MRAPVPTSSGDARDIGATSNKTDTKGRQNKTLSDSNEPVLAIQGVPWIMRKGISKASLELVIKQTEEGGVTHLEIEVKPSMGPAQKESRVLDWDQVSEANHPLFGNGKARSKWAKLEDLSDEYLTKGWEEGTTEVIVQQNEMDSGANTTLVHGFEIINGKRYYVRHVVTKKGKEEAKVKLVYDYLGSA